MASVGGLWSHADTERNEDSNYRPRSQTTPNRSEWIPEQTQSGCITIIHPNTKLRFYMIEAYATVLHNFKQSVFPVILALRRNNNKHTHTHTQDWAVSTLWCLVHNSVWLRYMTIYIKVSGGFGKNKLNSIHLLCQNDLAT